ncbi:MAG TPA: putative zinc-binding protein [Permianibacter sp.]|nr:putative zinc-binding protein [Permianibacter sp.]
MAATTPSLPLVYSCSGCSSSAQLANDLALALDREQLAEMSCIAGVGGDVPALVNTAKSGRAIVVIDGCSRVCAKRSLARHGVTPAQHVVLSQWGAKKSLHRDYRADELLIAKAKLHDCLTQLQEKLSVATSRPANVNDQNEERP